MGKFTRRGSIIGTAALAGALAFSTTAFAAGGMVDGEPIADDESAEIIQEVGPDVYRFADRDRVGTAIKAAENTDREHWDDTAIIANSQVFADALAASPLADVLDAPVLLSNPGNAVSSRVVDYLNTAGFTNVILVGGTDVFGDAVTEQLEAFNVERYDGPNRYQTAIALADAAMVGGDFENIFLASGTNFPDALAAGAAAANNSGVVLLTKGDEGLDTMTYAALSGTGSYDGPMDEIHGSFVAIGGPAAAGLEAGWQGDPIEADAEIVGEDRYETATQTAAEYFDGEAGETANVVLTSGQNFPDAVVGGAYAANADGPLLLTQENHLPNTVADYLENTADRDNVEQVFTFGGEDSVSKSVTQAVADLEWTY